MGITNTLCLSGTALLKAGSAVSSTLTTDANQEVEEFIRQAECVVIGDSMVNWIAIYSTLSSAKKYILEEAVSCWAAMSMINYDMSGYTTRAHAETMLNVLIDKYRTAIKILTEDKRKTKLQEA